MTTQNLPETVILVNSARRPSPLNQVRPSPVTVPAGVERPRRRSPYNPIEGPNGRTDGRQKLVCDHLHVHPKATTTKTPWLKKMSKQIVIVGGGGAGIDIAQALLKKLAGTEHKIILVAEKDYYAHYIAALRSLSGPAGDTEWPESTAIPLDRVFENDKNASLVVARATSIEHEGVKGTVITDRGDPIPYDVLVLTTGINLESPLNLPATRKEALQHFSEWQEKIKNAEAIAIVGGGPVGIATAIDGLKIQSKPITIVHNKRMLLSEKYPEKFRRDLANRLAPKNVQLILDDSIDVENTRDEIITAKGVHVKADLLIPARGPKPNSALLETLTPRAITSSGHADVEATLQLKGYTNIFALGDIIDWEGEVRQRLKHMRQVPVACDNIADVLAGREPQAKYTKSFESIFITIGKTGGAAYVGVWWGITVGSMMVRTMKGKALLVPRVKKVLGY